MEKQKWFIVSSWGTIIIAIWVIFGAFDPVIAYFGDFYTYLIFISGIIGIFGAMTSLGIFPTVGGLAVSISMVFLSFQTGFGGSILFTFLRGTILIIFGSVMILTFEESINEETYELPRLGINKAEYYALKDLGITSLQDLIEEKGNEDEICSISEINRADLIEWIKKAEEIIQKRVDIKKEQLKKDFKQKYKK
ncbi:MAG: hypothetical protein ACTSQI_02940 [Candidatus Helarchaeota archaeon]